jgi:hypothetical protein
MRLTTPSAILKMAPALHLLDGLEDDETKTRRSDKQLEANKQAHAAVASLKPEAAQKQKMSWGVGASP